MLFVCIAKDKNQVGMSNICEWMTMISTSMKCTNSTAVNVCVCMTVT